MLVSNEPALSAVVPPDLVAEILVSTVCDAIPTGLDVNHLGPVSVLDLGHQEKAA